MRLSPSALNIFVDCPRCFWLDKKQKVKRMRGIMSTLPMGMDGLIKKYFDEHRAAGTFPKELMRDTEIENDMTLFDDQLKLNKWRNWRSTNLVYDVGGGYTLSGMIDELLMKGDIAIPADYKTRGYPYKNPADALKYYQLQMECYGLMLKSYGMEVYDKGYLIYYVPQAVCKEGIVKFDISAIPVPINTDNPKKVCEQAVACLESKEIPESSKECEYCNYVITRSDMKGGQSRWTDN